MVQIWNLVLQRIDIEIINVSFEGMERKLENTLYSRVEDSNTKYENKGTILITGSESTMMQMTINTYQSFWRHIA